MEEIVLAVLIIVVIIIIFKIDVFDWLSGGICKKLPGGVKDTIKEKLIGNYPKCTKGCAPYLASPKQWYLTGQPPFSFIENGYYRLVN